MPETDALPSLFQAIRRKFPPMPWARFEDGERLGWETSWRIWKAFVLPYRTAPLRGFQENGDMDLGPWTWHRPDLWRNK